jgi:hypothetical protein
MRTLTCVLLIAAACLTGCSREPSAKDFERFAAAHADKISGEQIVEGGAPRTYTASLVKHNLRKTDSLTSPFVGEAEYRIEISGLTLRHPKIDGYATPAICVNHATLRFGWTDGEWEHYGGECRITDIITPELDAATRSKLGDLHDSPIVEVSANASAKGNIGILVNGVTMTEKDFYRVHAGELKSRP